MSKKRRKPKWPDIRYPTLDEVARIYEHPKLYESLSALNADEEDVIVLKYWAGKSLREIGEKLNLSHARIGQILIGFHQHRISGKGKLYIYEPIGALAKLRKRLRKLKKRSPTG